jgi:hypothetical protein
VAGPVSAPGSRLVVRRPDATTLDVKLSRTLAAGEPIDVTVPFRLRLPGAVADRLSRMGGSLRLGSFVPVLAWEPGVGWDTDPPTALLAETSSTPTADFDVHITAPPGVGLLTTGEPAGNARCRAEAVRDFGIAVGRFDIATATARAPGPVRITAAVDRSVEGLPMDVARRAKAALEAISARYGPYPWPTLHLVVVPALGRVGIEYPTMIFPGPQSVARACRIRRRRGTRPAAPRRTGRAGRGTSTRSRSTPTAPGWCAPSATPNR